MTLVLDHPFCASEFGKLTLSDGLLIACITTFDLDTCPRFVLLLTIDLDPMVGILEAAVVAPMVIVVVALDALKSYLWELACLDTDTDAFDDDTGTKKESFLALMLIDETEEVLAKALDYWVPTDILGVTEALYIETVKRDGWI